MYNFQTKLNTFPLKIHVFPNNMYNFPFNLKFLFVIEFVSTEYEVPLPPSRNHIWQSTDQYWCMAGTFKTFQLKNKHVMDSIHD